MPIVAELRELTPERSLIFRLTHVDNLPWILANGLHCQTFNVRDPNFVEIGNPDLIERRPAKRIPIAPGETLAHYVPFYFTPCSPMLYNIRTGWNNVCTAPGFLDTRLRYAAWRSSYCSRASSGVRYASFSRRQHWL